MTELSAAELKTVVGGVMRPPPSLSQRAQGAVQAKAAKDKLLSSGKEGMPNGAAAAAKALDDLDAGEITPQLEAYQCGIGTRIQRPLTLPLQQMQWPRACDDQIILG